MSHGNTHSTTNAPHHLAYTLQRHAAGTGINHTTNILLTRTRHSHCHSQHTNTLLVHAHSSQHTLFAQRHENLGLQGYTVLSLRLHCSGWHSPLLKMCAVLGIGCWLQQQNTGLSVLAGLLHSAFCVLRAGLKAAWGLRLTAATQHNTTRTTKTSSLLILCQRQAL